MANTSIIYQDVTVTLNGYPFKALAAGDQVIVTPVNPKTSRNNHRNYTTINERGDWDVSDITINYIKGSEDDVQVNQWILSSDVVVFKGSIAENYSVNGVSRTSTYLLEAGTITTLPTDTKNDQDGNHILSIVIQARTKPNK